MSKTLSSLLKDTGSNCNCSDQSFGVLDNWSMKFDSQMVPSGLDVWKSVNYGFC